MKITTENIRVNFQAKEILKGISIETRDVSGWLRRVPCPGKADWVHQL